MANTKTAVTEAVNEVKTEEQVIADRKATLTRVMEDGTTKFRCQYCRKWISADSFEEFMAGSYCHHLRDELGWTEADLREHRASMSATDVPTAEDGREYVKVAIAGRVCRKNGIPVSRLINAFGKDRCIDGAMHPNFQPVYVGRSRYIHPDCIEAWGLNFLRNMGGRENGAGKTTEQATIEAALS